MKRVIILLACFALASLCGFLPWKSSDAADLLPVETLLVDCRKEGVEILAADGLRGKGEDLAAAMADMQAQAPGELFFGQVSRVIMSDGAGSEIRQAAEHGLLRLNTAIYHAGRGLKNLANQITDLESYWRASEQRGALTTLLDYCADGTLAVEIDEDGAVK